MNPIARPNSLDGKSALDADGGPGETVGWVSGSCVTAFVISPREWAPAMGARRGK
jgi:hypothetical protein